MNFVLDRVNNKVHLVISTWNNSRGSRTSKIVYWFNLTCRVWISERIIRSAWRSSYPVCWQCVSSVTRRDWNVNLLPATSSAIFNRKRHTWLRCSIPMTVTNTLVIHPSICRVIIKQHRHLRLVVYCLLSCPIRINYLEDLAFYF